MYYFVENDALNIEREEYDYARAIKEAQSLASRYPWHRFDVWDEGRKLATVIVKNGERITDFL